MRTPVLVVAIGCILTSCSGSCVGRYTITNPPAPPPALSLPNCHDVTPAPGVSCYECRRFQDDPSALGLGSAECPHRVVVTYEPKAAEKGEK